MGSCLTKTQRDRSTTTIIPFPHFPLDYFPFVILGVAEEDIAAVFFTLVGHFDTPTLLKFRAVSKRWRDYIDAKTLLWTRITQEGGFIRACADSNIAIFNRLLELPELDVNFATNYGQTGFHAACKRGHLHIINRLLELPQLTLIKKTILGGRGSIGHVPKATWTSSTDCLSCQR